MWPSSSTTSARPARLRLKVSSAQASSVSTARITARACAGETAYVFAKTSAALGGRFHVQQAYQARAGRSTQGKSASFKRLQRSQGEIVLFGFHKHVNLTLNSRAGFSRMGASEAMDYCLCAHAPA